MTVSFWNAVFVSGLAGAVLSGLALMTLSLIQVPVAAPPVAPINATSHWVFGPRAATVRDITLAETGVGLATHVGSAIFWGGVTVVTAQAVGATSSAAIIPTGLGVAAAAVVLDYGLLPRRISPGWHLVLPWWAVGIGFAALGLGLGLGAAGSMQPL